MLTLKTATLTVALLASFGITNLAQAMVIDAFNEGTGVTATDQPPANNGAVIVSEGSAAWTTVIGGARELSSDMTASSAGSNRVNTFVSGGAFQSVLTNGAKGISKVHWDGLADGILSTSGLGGAGGLDLTAGSSTRFDLVLASDDVGGSIGLTLWDNDSFFTSSITSLITTSALTYSLDFTAFTGIDFTKVGAIELSLAAIGSRTVKIDSLQTQNGNTGTPGLPEPATLALLGLGLAGLGWSKRNRAA